MSKKTLNRVLGIIIVAGIIGLGYIWNSYGGKPDAQQAPTLSSNIANTIQLDGTLVSEKNADLGFVLSANIATLPVKVGDSVNAGQILATQNNTDLKAQVSAAAANVQSASAQLDALTHSLKGAQIKIREVSGDARKEQRTAVSSVKSNIDAQSSAVAASQDNLKSAQAELDKSLLKAPFDGVITRQDGEVGEVGGGIALPFLTISSNEPLEKIEAFASDLDAANIKVGQVAKVTFDSLGADKTGTAKVVSIDPSTASSQGKSAYKVTLRLDQPDPSLKAGIHAAVAF